MSRPGSDPEVGWRGARCVLLLPHVTLTAIFFFFPPFFFPNRLDLCANNGLERVNRGQVDLECVGLGRGPKGSRRCESVVRLGELHTLLIVWVLRWGPPGIFSSRPRVLPVVALTSPRRLLQVTAMGSHKSTRGRHTAVSNRLHNAQPFPGGCSLDDACKVAAALPSVTAVAG
jgi:hypothetical protein